MSEKTNGAFVNLIRKAVGLPTGESSCCGAPATSTESTCCNAPAEKESKDAATGGCASTAPATDKKSSGCCN